MTDAEIEKTLIEDYLDPRWKEMAQNVPPDYPEAFKDAMLDAARWCAEDLENGKFLSQK